MRSLQRRAGAQVDITKPIRFQFDGKDYLGFEGDTLASALLANGVTVIGRSFKFHRPRGFYGVAHEDPNALVQLGQGAYTEPNVRANLQPLYEGLRAWSQNRWPSVRFDLLSILNILKPLLPASFYYKTFFWPGWKTWEPLVRRLAGLGRAPEAADPETHVKQHRWVDVLVVGAGRAGLLAAIEAARDQSLRVLLVDAAAQPGGFLASSPQPMDQRWLDETLARLRKTANIEWLPRTLVTGYYDHNLLAAYQSLAVTRSQQGARGRLLRIHAGRVVLATGAHERPLLFPGNDRPGVMLASALREYFLRFGVTPCERAAFYVNNNSGWRTALELSEQGLNVVAVIDVRKTPPQEFLHKADELGITVYCGFAIAATQGRPGISRLQLRRLNVEAERLSGAPARVRCDLLALAGGWTPAVHLWSQSGGKLDWRERDTCFVPASASQDVSAVGYANGEFESPLALQAFWKTPQVRASRQWLDLQYDVTAADVELAVRENYRSVEHLKRYTTNGMSVDQGKTSNVNGLALLAEATGRTVPEVGTTRFRPPYHPVPVGSFAGIDTRDFYRPRLFLPAHAAHVELGGHLADFAGWQRPECYPTQGESESQAVGREVAAVRNAVGLLDYSSLGKIEVSGPDARDFLNRVYANNLASLKPGRARYGLMLRETGVVFDDGVVVCLQEDRFLLHTTSANARSVYQWLEEWLQCEWPELQVLVSDVTSQWATFMVSGPSSRELLKTLPTDFDLDAGQFGHMHFQQGEVSGVPARLLRASFTGELTFEVSVPADFGLSLFRLLMQLGKPLGVTPVGVESLMVLRTEKGYLHVGADTDTSTMPQDLGWGAVLARKETDFIGRRSLSLEVALDPQRKQLVAIELKGSDTVPAGAHVLPIEGGASQGFLTSSHFSPTLGRNVALGLVEAGRDRIGEQVRVFDAGTYMDATLVPACSYDIEGEKLYG